jgi:hypothetical protein
MKVTACNCAASIATAFKAARYLLADMLQEGKFAKMANMIPNN